MFVINLQKDVNNDQISIVFIYHEIIFNACCLKNGHPQMLIYALEFFIILV